MSKKSKNVRKDKRAQHAHAKPKPDVAHDEKSGMKSAAYKEDPKTDMPETPASEQPVSEEPKAETPAEGETLGTAIDKPAEEGEKKKGWFG